MRDHESWEDIRRRRMRSAEAQTAYEQEQPREQQVEISADPEDSTRGWLTRHFHVGAHDGAIACRWCGRRFRLDPDGVWRGHHATGCAAPLMGEKQVNDP